MSPEDILKKLAQITEFILIQFGGCTGNKTVDRLAVVRASATIGLSDTTVIKMLRAAGQVAPSTLERLEDYAKARGWTTQVRLLRSIRSENHTKRKGHDRADTVVRRALAEVLASMSGRCKMLAEQAGVAPAEFSNLRRCRRPADTSSVDKVMKWLKASYPALASTLDEKIEVMTRQEHKCGKRGAHISAESKPEPVPEEPEQAELELEAGNEESSVLAGSAMWMLEVCIRELSPNQVPDLVVIAMTRFITAAKEADGLGMLTSREKTQLQQLYSMFEAWKENSSFEILLRAEYRARDAEERAKALAQENEELMKLLKQAKEILEQGKAMSEVGK